MLCFLNLHKTLSTLAVSSNNFFFGTSLKDGNLSFCFLPNTPVISSLMEAISS